MSILTPRVNDLESKDVEIEGKIVKNLLINGMFEFSQRKGFNSSTTDNDVYIPDRWLKNAGDSSQVINNGPQGFKNAYELVVTNGHNFQQRVETIFLDQDMVGKTATFYIYARITSGSPFVPQIRYANATAENDWSGQNVIETTDMIGETINSDFQKYYYQFTVTQEMVDNGLYVRPGDWVGGISYTVQYTKAALYIDDNTDRDFQRAGRNYQEELQLCQRYYEKSYPLDAVPGSNTTGTFSFYSSTSLVREQIPFQVRKRDIPTVFIYNPVTGVIGEYRNENNSSNTAVVAGARHSMRLANNSHIAAQASSVQWTADAEL